MEYQEQTFNLPALEGISAEQIEVHLGLYRGYVKHTNLIREKIHELEVANKEGNTYTIAELRRRFSFEFDGMRMHEYYFESLEDGAKTLEDGALKSALADKYGSFDGFIEHFKAVGMSRGIGWTVLYWDPKGETPHVAWVSDHELGVLAGLPVLIAMDMWEHAFMVDHVPAEKSAYIDAFLKNLNWSVVERRFGTL
ncbi:MAG: Fe-Mn family superoxide dismutase [Candidatus Pacebacteria bacterium]|nr:Fe-Mn family superoxide dismutase [Candidatus Paceibacterota bacterium]